MAAAARMQFDNISPICQIRDTAMDRFTISLNEDLANQFHELIRAKGLPKPFRSGTGHAQK
jgi:predicted restriction endonuclease